MDFNTLPGTRFILNDSTVSYGPPPAFGDSILVIGCALDGPVNTPVGLQGLSNVEAFFGPAMFDTSYTSPDADPTKKGTYSYNSLMKACTEVVSGGGANIILVRVGGVTATSGTGPGSTLLGGILAQGMFPGNVYTGAQLSAVSDPLNGTVLTIVNQPASKGVQGAAFSFPPTATYGQICQQFNKNRLNKTFQLRCPTSIATGTAITNPQTIHSVTLAGGTNGTAAPGDDFYGNKAAYFTAITQTGGAFEQVSGVNADLVVVADLYADDDITGSPSYSFLKSLGVFCYQQSRDNYPALAIIGTRPLSDTSQVGIQKHVNNLTNVNTGVYDDVPSKLVNVAQFIQEGIPYNDPEIPGGQAIDLGRHMSIVAGPDVYYNSGILGSYVDSPATFLTGMISSKNPQQALTNQSLRGGVTLAYQFTKSQRNVLNAGINFTGQNDGLGGGAYLTLSVRQPGGGEVVVTEDVTAASRNSSFKNLQVMRIIQATERVVEGVCQKFIGQSNDPGTVATLESQLQGGLDEIAGQGALFGGRGSGYDFKIGSNALDGQIGVIRISMWLRPARQLKRIETTVTVKNN